MRRIILILTILLLIETSLALEPVISVSPVQVNKSVLILGKISNFFEVFTFDGNESANITFSTEGEIAGWIKLQDNSIMIGPNSSRKVYYTINVPRTNPGTYGGKIKLATSKGQVDEINLTISTSYALGKFVIEGLSGNKIVSNFSVFVYKNNDLIYHDSTSNGYLISDYFPYGEYKVIVRSDFFYEASKNIFLNAPEIVLLYNLTRVPTISIKLIPEQVVMDVCETETGSFSITIKNDGEEDFNASVRYDDKLIKPEIEQMKISSKNSFNLGFKTKKLSEGNYTTTIGIGNENLTRNVSLNLRIIPLSQCSITQIAEIKVRDRVEVAKNYISPIVVIVRANQKLGTLIISVKSKFFTEVYPQNYLNLKIDEEAPFLIRIIPNETTNDTLLISLRSNVGEMSDVVSVSVYDSLNKEIVGREINDTRELLNNIRSKIIQKGILGERIDEPMLLVGEYLTKLDMASTLYESDLKSAKEYVDMATVGARQMLVDYVAVTEVKKTNYAIIILVLIIIAFIATLLYWKFILPKRKKEEAERKGF
ncbi:MAG: hypothetical protein OH354_01480 [Candidatus Parvarchaeota archaeon]|nr:hypothetical protein [Candidatus Jingweiarchaeum tengchongense]MCW1300076.1 hypothetical protein [Candidatus Jingweiarchaeum tengchongense]MCW1304430.1 hypothetical protein [Candidatus Jingweiarchaeum tengchongense]MCW1305597.1 hypothetical protein [Candidatus Jingweiarchaeum tengchongense]MCW1310978.1 hypothetical protein [Candidatus Jingweiarchaeum tengchongense]